ncbi:MAG TPA: gliding motility-associated ABC transporter ATP-binding subunit GldA [Bacteroidales bacterium]|mgnify:CR=1 FL=1|nr:gliding motility-associated ABC transporter ATP-binding subunit GldA [Bacteroidales bacterium]HOX78645.1 gliding motility-associated ABC transporter ATP-binding subunit GldA [Bacteroidales bacterium]HPI85793.1 gliding motility-associated ABC transporter ATP-binding subunit GldA [Bacteroidales bacterium]HPM93852.1 gliding motility-associated ABC transporter ATP-binding subunit GldA [Bacteroidales bacterium]
MSIEVSNVIKIYDTQKALDNVSMSVKPGEIVGLLGPNGAGKSTLMKIITCFIPPTEGAATICGYDIFENSLKVREKVGYLPEHNPLYLDMYVGEYLEFVAGIHKIKSNVKSRIGEMIELTGLTDERKKKIGALSKGYRQRVGLAQALIHDPEVLILDEPTSGLDPNQISEIRHLIRSVGATKTVMLSTHIMQEVEAICDRAIIIHKGRIVADDATRNLTTGIKNRNRITVEFSGKIDSQDFKRISGITGIERKSEKVWALETAEGRDIREELFSLAVSKGIAILSMNREELRLEEVFQILTQG